MCSRIRWLGLLKRRSSGRGRALHSLVTLELRGLKPGATVQVLRKPKSFPVTAPFGPARPVVERSWSWTQGLMPDNLQQAYREWLGHMESDLCVVHGLSGRAAQQHCGRAKGPQWASMSIDRAAKSTAAKTFSKEALGWAT